MKLQGKVQMIHEPKHLELVSKELNHLAAILHVYAWGLIFMKLKNIPYARHYKPRLVHFFNPFPKTIYVL